MSGLFSVKRVLTPFPPLTEQLPTAPPLLFSFFPAFGREGCEVTSSKRIYATDNGSDGDHRTYRTHRTYLPYWAYLSS